VTASLQGVQHDLERVAGLQAERLDLGVGDGHPPALLELGLVDGLLVGVVGADDDPRRGGLGRVVQARRQAPLDVLADVLELGLQRRLDAVAEVLQSRGGLPGRRRAALRRPLTAPGVLPALGCLAP
jgi:hypothetical protein